MQCRGQPFVGADDQIASCGQAADQTGQYLPLLPGVEVGEGQVAAEDQVKRPLGHIPTQILPSQLDTRLIPFAKTEGIEFDSQLGREGHIEIGPGGITIGKNATCDGIRVPEHIYCSSVWAEKHGEWYIALYHETVAIE